jgi:hypothetical protein
MAGEAEDTLLSVVVTDSVVLTRLADSPGAASVQDSGGRGNFLAFLVAGIAAALGDRGFRGRGRNFRDFDGDAFGSGFYGFGYPYYYPYYYSYPY